MSYLNIPISDNQKQKLKELKKKEGGTQADIMRKALNQYYRNELAGEIPLPQGTKAIQISFLK